jgi:D-glycero-D-manno-heptose 1,7-bisphosphate phosphatase
MHPYDPRAFPAPLPGTEARPRALFVDRWGTLLQPPEQGSEARFDPALFVAKAVDALFRASHAGWSVYLIGNEEAVACGRVSDGAWMRFEESLLAHLAAYGVRVGRSYACLDHPEQGKGRHKRDSVFLLPNTGAMYHAMQHDGIALGKSWVIGDSTPELVAGWRSGCHVAGVRTGNALGDLALSVEPELVGDHLAAVVTDLLRQESCAC